MDSLVAWLGGILLSSYTSVPGWTITLPPDLSAETYVVVAESSKPVEDCRADLKSMLVLPKIPFATQEVSVDGGTPLISTGLLELEGIPALSSDFFPCNLLKDAKYLSWKITTHSIFLLNFSDVPRVSRDWVWKRMALDIFNLALSIATCVVGFLLMIMALGKTDIATAVLLFVVSIFIPVYSVLLNLSDPRFMADPRENIRLSLFAIWLGAPMLFYCMRQRGFVGRRSFTLLLFLTPLAIYLVSMGKTVDQIVSASFLMHLGVVPCLFSVIWYVMKNLKRNISTGQRVQFICLMTCVGGALLEVLKLYGGFFSPVL